MTKSKIKKPDSRAKALHAMNRATLIHTVQTLDKRQVTLLNKIAKLEAQITAMTEPLLVDPNSAIGQIVREGALMQLVTQDQAEAAAMRVLQGGERDACELFNVAVQDHDLLPRNKMPWET